MAVTTLAPDKVIAECAISLGLSADIGIQSREFLGATVRRVASVACPCAAATLRARVIEALQHLVITSKDLTDLIDDAIEGLTVGGDFVEIVSVVDAKTAARTNWLYATPPSFVVRESGTIAVLGVAPDGQDFLPQNVAKRITAWGYTRVLRPDPKENWEHDLCDLGLVRIPEDAWCKRPRVEMPADHLASHETRLNAGLPSGAIRDLEILDPSRSPTYYPGRWIIPTHHSGTYVARRKQEFGNPLWCFVRLESGTATRVIDLPARVFRWRGCDAAWHLQMAIDHLRGAPQLYQVNKHEDVYRMRFFSPLPLWAQRRLLLVAMNTEASNGLPTYDLAAEDLASEEAFLRNELWLKRTDNSNGEARYAPNNS